jgi:hypothetical protein
MPENNELNTAATDGCTSYLKIDNIILQRHDGGEKLDIVFEWALIILKMKKIITVFLLSIVCLPAFAINLDSLLNNKITVSKPYLILNVTSTECITCRAAAVNVLNKIKGAVDNKKIILLSDDKNMNIYFKDNKDIFGDYQTVFDRSLSRLFARGGPSATACVVGNDSVHIFTLVKANNDTIKFIKSLLAEKVTGNNKRMVVHDSVIRNSSQFYFHKKNVLFLNTQFQVGLSYNIGSNTVGTKRLQCNNQTIERLLGIWRKDKENNHLSTADITNALLKKKGVAPVTVNAINLRDGSACFKLYATSISVSENKQDTTIMILANLFLATDLLLGSDPLNLNDYRSFSLLGPVPDVNDTLNPLGYDYELSNDRFYVPYWNSRGSTYRVQNGRKIMNVTDVRIAELNFKNNDAVGKVNVYSIKDGAKGPGKFFFRLSDNGLPLVVSKTNKSINFSGKDKRLLFNELVFENADTVNNIFDIASTGNVLKLVAVTTSGVFVKGTYDLATGKVQLEKLDNKNVVYDNLAIDGNDILAFRKNEEENELILDQFTFKDSH